MRRVFASAQWRGDRRSEPRRRPLTQVVGLRPLPEALDETALRTFRSQTKIFARLPRNTKRWPSKRFNFHSFRTMATRRHARVAGPPAPRRGTPAQWRQVSAPSSFSATRSRRAPHRCRARRGRTVGEVDPERPWRMSRFAQNRSTDWFERSNAATISRHCSLFLRARIGARSPPGPGPT
jgi:hypothetical protein